MTFDFNGKQYPVWDDVNNTLFWIPGWTAGPFVKIVRDKYGLENEVRYYNNTYVYRNRSIFRDLDELDFFQGYTGSTVGADSFGVLSEFFFYFA
jgi:hypothetical protein